MAEIKRVNIYMGVVGQAYVDKETALKDLNAAIKNVHDMEEIIQAATEQQPIAQSVYEDAVAAQQLAQAAYDQLSQKFDSTNETDTLYNQLLNIVKDLNVNDNDNNPYNGGSNKTAQENVEEIQKQINELASIIEDGNESLQRRLSFVDELQVIYDNALEVFKSYLPEEEGYDWDAWDKEEQLLWARINAVVKKLALANEITEAINNTSKDVIKNAVDVILSVSRANDEKLVDIQSSEYNYINAFNSLQSQLNGLRESFTDINNNEANAQIQNIDNDLNTIDNYLSQLNNDAYPRVNDLINTNMQIISTWENIHNSINDTFNLSDFDTSVNDIYYVDSEIKGAKDLINELKNYERLYNRNIVNYQTALYSIQDQENQEEPINYPDTIDINGVTYYKDEPASPGENYILETTDYNGHLYYAWIYQGGEEPQSDDKWFSIGIEEVTADNYTTVNGAAQVSSYPSETEYTPESRSYLYILVENDKTVQVIDATINAEAFITEDTASISGYKIISTNGKVGGKVYIRIS